MESRSGAGKEVDDQRIRTAPDHGCEDVSDFVNRLRERERFGASQQSLEQIRPVGARVVGLLPPDGDLTESLLSPPYPTDVHCVRIAAGVKPAELDISLGDLVTHSAGLVTPNPVAAVLVHGPD